jgi:hypothetical protein
MLVRRSRCASKLYVEVRAVWGHSTEKSQKLIRCLAELRGNENGSEDEIKDEGTTTYMNLIFF